MLKVRENRREISSRIEIARIIVGGVFAVLAVSYWYVQIVRGDYYFGLKRYCEPAVGSEVPKLDGQELICARRRWIA